jgi:hypothetical protein
MNEDKKKIYNIHHSEIVDLRYSVVFLILLPNAES